jgi:hypothetical protein
MLDERVVLPDEVMLEVSFHSPTSYRLACSRGKRLLVEYSSEKAYEFKSVEKLRYDFERDAEDALRSG